jgi:pimeloyl-ACP methyl ester carboxylesterase
VSANVVALGTGADARLRNAGSRLAVVLVNGGTARAVPGTWSATSELLADELEQRVPAVTLVEVRYRIKTWNELPSCIADAQAALELAAREGAGSVFLVGFSMGGAVAIAVAEHASVAALLGLAPWIPDRLPVDTVRGKRFDVVHGGWDRYTPLVPGVSPSHSRAGFERVLAAGASGTYTVIPRGLHGCALRRPSGGLVRLPRWRAWVAHTAAAVEQYASGQVP